MDGGYRGSNANQDIRFSDKEKKLLKQMKFEDCLDQKVDSEKVNVNVLKPWITGKLNTILGMEDDVVVEYVFTQLEEKNLNPKVMQINLTGFLNARRSREFMGELWQMLLEAQSSPDGIPVSLIDKKMSELRAQSGNLCEIPMAQATENDWRHRYKSLTGGRYGKTEPNYDSKPGAGDEVNRDYSPSERRQRRERSPEDYKSRREDRDRRDRDLDRRRNRDRRDDRLRRDRSRSRERKRERSTSIERRPKDRATSPERELKDRSTSPERKPKDRSTSPERKHKKVEVVKPRRRSSHDDEDKSRRRSPRRFTEDKIAKKGSSPTASARKESEEEDETFKKRNRRDSEDSGKKAKKHKKEKKKKHKRDRD